MSNLIFVWFFILFLTSSCLCYQDITPRHDYFSATARRNIYRVTDFGAIAKNGIDNSQAFLKAWRVVCGAEGNPTMLIPRSMTFLLTPITFQGPCKANNVNIQIEGIIIAPNNIWDISTYDVWIRFLGVQNLRIYGGGIINGQGFKWWDVCNKKLAYNNYYYSTILDGGVNCNNRPTAVHFWKCDNLMISSVRFINSQRNHISLNGINGATISRIGIFAPEDSPNTDGIDISQSTNIIIRDSLIETGDDCIAINGGSTFINITGLTCGPGHGISVGSLGANGAYDTVEEVHVRNCTLTKTQNGVRIKTWEDGSGYARKISFEDIILEASENPIIITQNYHNGMMVKENRGGGVRASDITYKNIYGTSASEIAIKFDCNRVEGCTGVILDRINITAANPSMKLSSVCNNAQGKESMFVIPSVSCL